MENGIKNNSYLGFLSRPFRKDFSSFNVFINSEETVKMESSFLDISLESQSKDNLEQEPRNFIDEKLICLSTLEELDEM